MRRFTITLKSNKLFKGLVAAVFWVGVWQLISMAVAQELLVPAPLAVLSALSGLIKTMEFWRITGISLARIMLGFLSGIAAGCIAAALTTRFKAADCIISPFLRIVRATPVASFTILALVWINNDWLPVFISFLMVVPIVWSNLESGIKQIDIQLLEMAKVYRLGFLKTLIFVRIPSVMPYFMAACATAMGFSWKSGIAAEVISRPGLSVGRQLYNAKIYLETPGVFAWTITVVLISLCLEKLLAAAAKKFGSRFNA